MPEKKPIVHGSEINLSALKDVKSIDDLKSKNIFQHLDDEDEAYNELWDILKTPAKFDMAASETEEAN